MPAIIRCLQCGQVVASQSRYDQQQCACPNRAMVQGDGEVYTKYSAMNLDFVETFEAGHWRPGKLSPQEQTNR